MIFGADISDIDITIWSLNIFIQVLLVVYNTTAPHHSPLIDLSSVDLRPFQTISFRWKRHPAEGP